MGRAVPLCCGRDVIRFSNDIDPAPDESEQIEQLFFIGHEFSRKPYPDELPAQRTACQGVRETPASEVIF